MKKITLQSIISSSYNDDLRHYVKTEQLAFMMQHNRILVFSARYNPDIFILRRRK